MVQIWCKTSAEKRNSLIKRGGQKVYKNRTEKSESLLKEGGQKVGRNGAENRYLQAKRMIQIWHKYVTEIGKLLGNFWVTIRGRQKADEIGTKLYQFFTTALPENVEVNRGKIGAKLLQLFSSASPNNDGKCRYCVGGMTATKRRLKGDQKCHRLVTNVSPVLVALLGTEVAPKNETKVIPKQYQFCPTAALKNCINSSLKLHRKQLRQGFGEVAVEIWWILCNIMMTIIHHFAWSIRDYEIMTILRKYA